MAAREVKKTIRFKMTFPQEVVGMPIMHTLSHDLDVTPNIMRGRVTGKGAWLEVELTGPPKNLEKALKFLEEKGITIQKLD
jgi:ABC-type methionine transport system ATPase subunit